MQKIPSLFVRDQTTHRVIDQVVLGCEWVIAGEGVATRKFDGTACMVKDGVLYKRQDAKGVNPPGWIPAQDYPDSITGHWPGWVPCVADDPQDKWHWEGWKNWHDQLAGYPEVIEDGTYELVGPKVNNNPEKFALHCLVKHGTHTIENAPRNFEDLKEWFCAEGGKDIEGIVWHHPDGRMVKIKKKDFWGRR